ncbi:MAG: thioredoxin family protein [Acidimicrobiia bacterium]|nr:thioredoxin family protein [Acidimicrobiia bacterium]
MQVTMRYFDGCPNWKRATKRLFDALDLEDLEDAKIRFELVETPEAAEAHDFRGSPTIVIDGDDAFDTAGTQVGLACRRYDTEAGPAGTPSLDQIRGALRKAKAKAG